MIGRRTRREFIQRRDGHADQSVRLVSCRADQPYLSTDDLWRRTGISSAALVELAGADAFRAALSLARREALWAIKPLRDEPLPLFAAVASARLRAPSRTGRACSGASDDDSGR